MLNDTALKEMATQSESELVERKQSRPSPRDIRIVLVAFANSVRSNECAVLFIGIGPRGEMVGVKDADGDQREIRKIAEHECYPPVECRFRVLQIDGKEIVAVLIPHSKQRPHFTGHSYVRKGSESQRSSEEQMETLIASRNDKASRLLERLGEKILIELRPPKPWSELAGAREVQAGRHSRCAGALPDEPRFSPAVSSSALRPLLRPPSQGRRRKPAHLAMRAHQPDELAGSL
jgi:hypothetical protein